jgi:hypothetical protein
VELGRKIGEQWVQTRWDRAILLERCSETPEPGYCVHGKTRCVRCNQWCWLGNNTFVMVAGGEALPLCTNCAVGDGLVTEASQVGVVRDEWLR